jgi:hypothetical protein
MFPKKIILSNPISEVKQHVEIVATLIYVELQNRQRTIYRHDMESSLAGSASELAEHSYSAMRDIYCLACCSTTKVDPSENQ